jgi:hypothetical protein
LNVTYKIITNFLSPIFPSILYFQLQCKAKIFDIYERDVVKYIDEYYPQILANSENGGVHFSFISDRDAAGKRFFNGIFYLFSMVFF